MLETITSILMSFINIFGITYISSKFLNCDINFKKPKTYIIIGISTILTFMSLCFINNSYIRFTCTIFITFFLIYMLYKQSLLKTIVTSIFSIVLIFISEILCSIFLNIIFIYNNQNFYYQDFKIILNIIITIIACIISICYKKRINRLIEMINSNKDLSFLILTLSLILILIIPISNLLKNNKDIVSIIIIVMFIITYVMFITSELKNRKIKSKYDELNYFMNLNDKMLAKYQMINHENKNNLLVIKNMVKNKSYNDTINYINEILGRPDENVYYKELKNIKSNVFKGFLQFKFSVIEEKQISINLDISTDMKKFDIEKILPKNRINDFYNVFGIILDNAIEATDKSDYINKVISINMYLDNNQYVINIANSFNEKIDLNQLIKCGYTTKGQGRGIGLALLDQIINKSSIFEIKREVIKNIFYCELRIKI